MNPELSIVIPCYNEEANLAQLIEKLRFTLRNKATEDCEIILVNNGSTDNTQVVLNKLLSGVPENVRTIRIEKNSGYGGGILFGLSQAKGRYLAWTHADLQTDPSDVFRALELYRHQAKEPILVKGFRVNRKWTEHFFSYGMGLLCSMVLKKKLREINAQPKLFSRVFYEKFRINAPTDFSLDLFVLYSALELGNVVEMPVRFHQRLHGEAKGGSGSTLRTRWKLIKRSIKYIFVLKSQLKPNHNE